MVSLLLIVSVFACHNSLWTIRLVQFYGLVLALHSHAIFCNFSGDQVRYLEVTSKVLLWWMLLCAICHPQQQNMSVFGVYTILVSCMHMFVMLPRQLSALSKNECQFTTGASFMWHVWPPFVTHLQWCVTRLKSLIRRVFMAGLFWTLWDGHRVCSCPKFGLVV